MGEYIDITDAPFHDVLRLYHMSLDDWDDFTRSSKVQELAKRGIIAIVPAKEAFDVFVSFLTKETYRESEKTYSERSIETYVYVVEQYMQYCLEKDPALQAHEIPKYLVDFLVDIPKEKVLSTTTMNRYIAILRTFIKNIAAYYHIPLSLLPRFQRVPEGPPLALSATEIHQLLYVAKRECHGFRYQFLLKFLLNTGLRRNEFRHVQLQHVHFHTSMLTVVKGKGNTQRVIPVDPMFLDEARTYFRIMGITKDRDYVFGNFKNPESQISNERIDQMFHHLVSKMQVYGMQPRTEGLNLHSLRHTYATHLYLNDVPLKEIARLLGHIGLKTTARYTLLDSPGLRKKAGPALSKMGKLIEGGYNHG